MKEGYCQNFQKLAIKCMQIYSDDIASLLFDHRSPRWRVVSARNFLKLAFKCIEMYSDNIVSLLFKHKSPPLRVRSFKIFKNWLLNAWKCTQITLYLYYLIIGAPGEGLVVPVFLKIGF